MLELEKSTTQVKLGTAMRGRGEKSVNNLCFACKFSVLASPFFFVLKRFWWINHFKSEQDNILMPKTLLFQFFCSDHAVEWNPLKSHSLQLIPNAVSATQNHAPWFCHHPEDHHDLGLPSCRISTAECPPYQGEIWIGHPEWIAYLNWTPIQFSANCQPNLIKFCTKIAEVVYICNL